jgi:hypothetical protein
MVTKIGISPSLDGRVKQLEDSGGGGGPGLPISVPTIADLPNLATYNGPPPNEVTIEATGQTFFLINVSGKLFYDDKI